ncbi:unnamed protein product [Linum trigynum]|uniref:Uncharacterized protein n=1 Tax=Linum trigynum TaxID=586398 RepID=A0AAV2DAA6_9ROSI
MAGQGELRYVYRPDCAPNIEAHTHEPSFGFDCLECVLDVEHRRTDGVRNCSEGADDHPRRGDGCSPHWPSIFSIPGIGGLPAHRVPSGRCKGGNGREDGSRTSLPRLGREMNKRKTN